MDDMIGEEGIRYYAVRSVIEILKDKDCNKAYAYTREICAESTYSDQYYQYFDDLLSLLKEENSYYKTRGIMIIASLSKWDREGKVARSTPQILTLLEDKKSVVVRKCIEALKEIVKNCPEIKSSVLKAVERIDITRFKDSMSPLIKKDIDDLYNTLN